MKLHLPLVREIAAWLVALGIASCAKGSKPVEAPYEAEAAPPECADLLDRGERERCLKGDGDACEKALHPFRNEITFDDTMTKVFPSIHKERLQCIVAFASRGCRLGSGGACDWLGFGRHFLNDDNGAKIAWLAACDRGQAGGCWRASFLWQNSAGDALLAERACDLGSELGCRTLGELTLLGAKRQDSNAYHRVENLLRHPGDAARGFAYLERACLIDPTESHACLDLRVMLSVPDCPRRDPDDFLPLLAVLAPPPKPEPPAEVEFPSEEPKAPASEAKGICEIDPAACPKADTGTYPHELPPALAGLKADPVGGKTRILDAHKAACVRGSARDCFRLVELEALRFDKSVVADERNMGAEAAFDVKAAAREQCARKIADACVFVSQHGGGVSDALRACDLGSPRGCAIAGHDLRAHGTDPGRAASLLSRACGGGIRWACALGP